MIKTKTRHVYVLFTVQLCCFLSHTNLTIIAPYSHGFLTDEILNMYKSAHCYNLVKQDFLNKKYYM